MLLVIGLSAFLAVCPASADLYTLPTGTPVGLVLETNLKSGASPVGTIVQFHTVAPIFSNDYTVLAPTGSNAFGVVTQSTKHAIFGKTGILRFSCEYVVASDGTRVPLTGINVYSSGLNGIGAAVAVSVFLSPVGLLLEGGDAEYHKGLPIEMWTSKATDVNEDSTTSS